MSERREASPLLFVVTGPTASGKGTLSHALALRLGCDVVSMDSMKVYREMDIATAKPSAERRASVRTHLVDFVDPSSEFSVQEWLENFESVLARLRTEGRSCILSGGTPLYLKAFLDGFRGGPAADWSLRRDLAGEIEAEGAGPLHARLRERDPVAAAKIHPQDVRRIVRALEVLETTGRAISADWHWSDAAVPRRSVRIFAPERPRPELYARIDTRVEDMVRRGLFEEASSLEKRIPPISRSASQAIGYEEIWRAQALGLERGEVVASIQRNTRRFAKRQMTWFRKLPIEWLPVPPAGDVLDLVGEVIRRLELPLPS